MAWQSNYEAIYNSTYGESPWGAASGLRSWSFWWLQTSLLSLFLVLFGWNFNVGVGVDFAGVNWQVDRNYGQNLSGHKSGPGPSMVNSYGQFTPASSDTNRRDMRSHPKKSHLLKPDAASRGDSPIYSTVLHLLPDSLSYAVFLSHLLLSEPR